MTQDKPAIPFRRVSDVIDSTDKWADLPRKDIDSLLGVEIGLLDVMVFPSTRFNNSEWAIVLCQSLDNDVQFTTMLGGEVAVRKLKELRERQLFPVMGEFIRKPATQQGYSDYYDLR